MKLFYKVFNFLASNIYKKEHSLTYIWSQYFESFKLAFSDFINFEILNDKIYI